MFAANIEMRHGVSYLQELPQEVRPIIEKKANDFLEGRVVEQHSNEWLAAVDKAFDELLPEWRAWLPKEWQKPPRA